MRFTSGTLTHEFFLLPTIRHDDQCVKRYIEFDWLVFYVGVVINNEDKYRYVV